MIAFCIGIIAGIIIALVSFVAIAAYSLCGEPRKHTVCMIRK